MKKVVKKKRPKRSAGILILIVSVVFVCGFFYYRRQELLKEYDALEAEEAELKNAISEEELRASELDKYKAYVGTNEYIEDVARDVLGLVYENEVIFKANEE